MKKGLIITLGVILTISMILASCAPKATAVPPVVVPPTTAPVQATTAPVQATAAPVQPTEVAVVAPVTISFLSIADDLQAQAMKKIVDRFHQIENGKYANVTIQFDAKPTADIEKQLQTAVATNSPLDVIQVDGPAVKHFAYNQLLKDLTADFSAAEMAQWVPQSVSEGSYNGKFYAPPMRQSCSIMWYNPKITEAAGIDVPKTLDAAWTYEEALAAWKKTTIDQNGDGVPEVWGILLGQGPYWGDYEYDLAARSAGAPGSPTFQGIAPDGVTFTGYFNTPEAVTAFEFVEKLYTTEKVATTEPIWDSFFTGNVAFNIYPDRLLGQIEESIPGRTCCSSSATLF